MFWTSSHLKNNRSVVVQTKHSRNRRRDTTPPPPPLSRSLPRPGGSMRAHSAATLADRLLSSVYLTADQTRHLDGKSPVGLENVWRAERRSDDDDVTAAAGTFFFFLPPACCEVSLQRLSQSKTYLGSELWLSRSSMKYLIEPDHWGSFIFSQDC